MTITHRWVRPRCGRNDPSRHRKSRFSDLSDALRKGTADFWAMPTHLVFLGLIYPVVGLVIARLVFGYDVLPLLFSLTAGFALIGPFAALGLYELSRRREKGRHLVETRFAVFSVALLPGDGRSAFCWLLIFFGAGSRQRTQSSRRLRLCAGGVGPRFPRPCLLRRPAGRLIVVGNGVGFLFALLVLTISVVSFPLLLDRPVSLIVAILTSVRAVAANPLHDGGWGVIARSLLVIGSLPLFIGLAIVMLISETLPAPLPERTRRTSRTVYAATSAAPRPPAHKPPSPWRSRARP